MDKEEVLKLEGFKKAKTDNLFSAIEKSKKVDLASFIYALGIENVGKKTAKDLAKRYLLLDNLIEADIDSLLSIEDVGEIVAKSIVDYFANEKNILEIEKLRKLGVEIEEVKTNNSQGVFSGERVVLTGSLESFTRDQAGKIIEELGGEIVSSVSKNTTLVLADEKAGSKLDKAIKLGIKIIDEQTLKSLIKT
jgi:DNA ligase (NAD+)